MNSIKKNQIVSIVLAVLMLLNLLNSCYFFIGILKLSIDKWLAFNACSLASISYLLLFIVSRVWKKNFLLAIPLLPLYYYGTMGLFVMPWTEANIFAHIGHIVITLNFIWILYMFIVEHKYESLGKGFLIGIVIYVPLFTYIQNYMQLHIEEFMKVLQKM